MRIQTTFHESIISSCCYLLGASDMSPAFLCFVIDVKWNSKRHDELRRKCHTKKGNDETQEKKRAPTGCWYTHKTYLASMLFRTF